MAQRGRSLFPWCLRVWALLGTLGLGLLGSALWSWWRGEEWRGVAEARGDLARNWFLVAVGLTLLFALTFLAWLGKRRAFDPRLLSEADVVRARDLRPGRHVRIGDYRPGPQAPSDLADRGRYRLQQLGGVFVVGPPQSGKSRLAWELLQATPAALVVQPTTAMPPSEFAPSGLKGRDVTLFVDDWHQTDPPTHLGQWRDRLAEKTGQRCRVVCVVGVEGWARAKERLAALLRDYGAPDCVLSTDPALLPAAFGQGQHLTPEGGTSVAESTWRPKPWEGPIRSRHFEGRRTDLKILRKRFLSGDDHVVVQAIHGLGGMGKTQLAAAYADHYAEEYDVVLWVRAGAAATLAADYASLAVPLGLDAAVAYSEADAIPAVQHRLETRQAQALLLFDNAPSAEALRAYLPRSGKTHVLVTSRDPIWRQVAEPHEIEELGENDAVRFLLRRTGKDGRSEAAALAKDLGRLPLALEQAGAYIDAQGISFEQYRELFRKEEDRLRLLAYEGTATDYRHTVLTTWSLAIAEVGIASPLAVFILRLLAFLGHDTISTDRLLAAVQRACDRSAGKWHGPLRGLWLRYGPFEPRFTALTAALVLWAMRAAIPDGFGGVVAAVGTLRRFGLVQTQDGRTLSMHPLVQQVVRDQMQNGERRSWCAAAIIVIDGMFPDDPTDPTTWPLAASLLSHAGVVTAQAGSLHADSGSRQWSPAALLLERIRSAETRRTVIPSAISLLLRTGQYLNQQAQYGEAEKLCRQALTIGEDVLGAHHPTVSTALDILATALWQQGDLAGAREGFERAVMIDEQHYGPGHPTVATSLSNLAGVLGDQRKPDEARPLLERALAIVETAYGSNHPRVAIALNNLGRVLRAQGDLAGAKDRCERALAIGQAGLGPEHPDVAIMLNNLANILRAQGDLAGTRERYEQAVTVLRNIYVGEHPLRVKALRSLARAHQDQGNWDEARALLEEVLANEEASPSPNLLRVAEALDNLGRVLHAQGDLAGARPLFERALGISEATRAPDHPIVAAALNNLATVLWQQGDLAAARPLFERALAIWEGRGEEAPAARVLTSLAAAAEQADDLIEAATWLCRLLTLRQRQTPSHDEGMCFYRLGRQATRLKRPEAGLRLLATCYIVDRTIDHPDAEEKDLPTMRLAATRLGYVEDRLQALLVEVEAAYAADRGRGLVAAGFPELEAGEQDSGTDTRTE